MRKSPLIGVSIIAVVVVILASLNNVVGFQTVQSSNQKAINESVNQRELLFQTIVDIANNKEIQRIILKSQMSRGISPPSEFPVVTISQVRQMYFIGLILSKIISSSRMQSVIGKYQFSNQEMQKEINAVIEKDAILNAEITLLKKSECDCENTEFFPYPIICGSLFLIFCVFGIPIMIVEYLFLLQYSLLLLLIGPWYILFYIICFICFNLLVVLGCMPLYPSIVMNIKETGG